MISLTKDMKPTVLILSFWIAMFLAHLMHTSSKLSKVKITYKKVPKIKKQGKQKQEFREFFSSSIEILCNSEDGAEEVTPPCMRDVHALPRIWRLGGN